MIKQLVWTLVVMLSHHVNAAEYSIIRQYVHPVIIVQSLTEGASLQTLVGSGSAISIAPGYVITAGHVVPVTAKDSMFIISGNQRLRATPVKIDRSRDLALLSVDLACPCAPLATTLPNIDDTVVAAGFPLYTTYRLQLVSIGTVQGNYAGTLATTSTTAPGGSGGGVFHKEKNDYRLVGITIAIGSNALGPRVMQIEQEYNWLTFSVPTDAIIQFLKNTPVEQKKAP